MQNNNKRKKGKEMKIKIRGLVFVGFAAAVFASSARAEVPNGQTAKTTVTSKNYVDAKFQAKEKRVELTGNQTYSGLESNIKTSNEHYPSMKVLSDAVGDGNFQPKLTTGGKPSLGTYDANGVQLWKAAASGEYVAVSEPVGGTTISFDIDSGTIADTATKIGDAGASDAGLGVKKRLTTAKAVYDYINGDGSGNGGFQPKVDAPHWNAQTSTYDHDTRNVIQVGQWNGTLDANGNVTANSATWADFVAAPDHGNDLGYLTIGQQVGGGFGAEYNINIDGTKIATSGSGIAAVENSSGAIGTDNKLATAGAVYNYAVKKDWGSANANKTLVTNGSGVVTVSDVPAMPEFGQNDVCKNQNVNCALVTTWIPADPSNNVEAHMELHWTVMADSTDTVTNP